MHRQSNTPSPDELLLTAREALKVVLSAPDTDHTYTILMAMNAMGIAARALRAGAPIPAHSAMSDHEFKQWARGADGAELAEREIVHNLRRHVEDKLAVSNPRFQAEPPMDQS